MITILLVRTLYGLESRKCLKNYNVYRTIDQCVPHFSDNLHFREFNPEYNWIDREMIRQFTRRTMR
jgi:hypothetical protein